VLLFRPALAPASLGAVTENKSPKTRDENIPTRHGGGQVFSIATVLKLASE